MGHSYLILAVHLLVLQSVVNAVIEIIDPYHRTLDIYTHQDATVNDVVMEGFIESANPPDACTIIASPTMLNNTTMKKMVLINGTLECGFMTKVQNAETAGYDVAVLFDPFPVPFEYHNITFPIPRSELNLSVVLVLYEDGVVIRNNYLYHNFSIKDNFTVKISPNVTWAKFFFIMSVWVIVSGLIVTSCVFFNAVFKWMYGKCRNQNEDVDVDEEEVLWNSEDFQSMVTRLFAEYGLTRNEGEIEERRKCAEKNLKRKYPSVEISKENLCDVCSICQSDYKDGEKIRVLACSHAYHSFCIDAWLLKHGIDQTCPLCRAKVNLENSYKQSISDPSEDTPLLSSSYGTYSTPRSGNFIWPCNALGATNIKPPHSSDVASNLVTEAQGSVNADHLAELDGDERQSLLARRESY